MKVTKRQIIEDLRGIIQTEKASFTNKSTGETDSESERIISSCEAAIRIIQKAKG